MIYLEQLKQRAEAVARYVEGLRTSSSDNVQLESAAEELSTCVQELQEAVAEMSLPPDGDGSIDEWRAEHKRYQDLFNFSPDGYLVTDRRGIIEEANLKAAEMLAVAPRYIAGKPVVLFLGGDQMKHLLDQAHLASQDPLNVTTWKTQVRPRSGYPFDAMIRSSLIFDAHGQHAGFRMLIRDITEEVKREADLETSQEELRALAARLQEIREEERNNLARELHDEFGAALTTLKLDLGWLKTHGASDVPELTDRIEEMSKLIDLTTDGIRRTATMLRPRLLDDFGLLAAIEWQVQEFEKRSGVSCDLTAEEINLPTDSATSVFRIFQECLTNVARYADATSVEIRLQKEANSWIVLQVHDDGKGFAIPEGSYPTSLGLIGMRERAYALRGDLSLESEPGKGTTVTLRIPHLPVRRENGAKERTDDREFEAPRALAVELSKRSASLRSRSEQLRAKSRELWRKHPGGGR